MSRLSVDPIEGGSICPHAGKESLPKGRAKSLAKRQERMGGNFCHAYKCLSCGGWHVGGRRLWDARR